MPLAAQSLTITYPPPWKGSFCYDTMYKSSEANTDFIVKRRLDDSEVSEPLIYWPRSFLIKEWEKGEWDGEVVSLKRHITLAAQQPCQHNWQEQAHCTVCHCPLWLLIPSGSLSHHFPQNSLFFPSSFSLLPGWELLCILLAVLNCNPANSSWFLLIPPPVRTSIFWLLNPRSERFKSDLYSP